MPCEVGGRGRNACRAAVEVAQLRSAAGAIGPEDIRNRRSLRQQAVEVIHRFYIERDEFQKRVVRHNYTA